MSARAALACLLALAAGCTKQYKVRLELTPASAERRLATGKADVVEGQLDRVDASTVFIHTDGQLEAVPRADVVRVDQREAKRDVRLGAVALALGGALVIGGLIYFECPEDKFPLFCPFESKRNFYAGAAFAGGVVIGAAGLRALFMGLGGQRDAESIPAGTQAARWQVVPTVVGGERPTPGLGAVGRF